MREAIVRCVAASLAVLMWFSVTRKGGCGCLLACRRHTGEGPVCRKPKPAAGAREGDGRSLGRISMPLVGMDLGWREV